MGTGYDSARNSVSHRVDGGPLRIQKDKLMNIIKPLTTALVAAGATTANPVRRQYQFPCSNGQSPDTAIGINSPVVGDTTVQRIHTYSFLYAQRHTQGTSDPFTNALLIKCMPTYTIASLNCGVDNVQTCPDLYSNCDAAGNAQLLATALDSNNNTVAQAFSDNTQGDITEFQNCLTSNFQSLVDSTLESSNPSTVAPARVNTTEVLGSAKLGGSSTSGALAGVSPKRAALALATVGTAALFLL